MACRVFRVVILGIMEDTQVDTLHIANFYRSATSDPRYHDDRNDKRGRSPKFKIFVAVQVNTATESNNEYLFEEGKLTGSFSSCLKPSSSRCFINFNTFSLSFGIQRDIPIQLFAPSTIKCVRVARFPLGIGTSGVAQGSEKGILSFKQKLHSRQEWNIPPKKKHPKLK